jgi:hypothetical protein
MALSYQAGKVLTATGFILVAAGGTGAALSEEPRPIVTYVVVPGVVLLALGLFLVIENYPASEEEVTQTPAEIAQREEYLRTVQQQREAAWALTKEAAAAARDGNCARVVELDANVKAMDAELHASTFARDIAIQRCLTAR